MRFSRRSRPSGPDETAADATPDTDADAGSAAGPDDGPEAGPQADSVAGSVAGDSGARPAGPHDVEDLTPEQLEARIDLGALVLSPPEKLQLRMQVDDTTKEVQAVLLAGPDGALELMAFAAARGDDGLWDEVRPQLAADMARRGGTADERQGPWGTELACRLTLQRNDGSDVVQPSRIIGIHGPRWMLRATLLGRPALDAEAAAPWEAVLADIAVRRGTEPRGVGEQLPFVLPSHARPLESS